MRTMMRGKHGKKSRFPALAALALCAVLIVTFMPNLMFSANAEDENKIVTQITAPAETTLTVPKGTSEEAVKKQLPTSLSAKIRQADNTEKDETINGITWSSDQYKSDSAGTYKFTSGLPSGYQLADGVSMPGVNVTVQQQKHADSIHFTVDKPDNLNGTYYIYVTNNADVTAKGGGVFHTLLPLGEHTVADLKGQDGTKSISSLETVYVYLLKQKQGSSYGENTEYDQNNFQYVESGKLAESDLNATYTHQISLNDSSNTNVNIRIASSHSNIVTDSEITSKLGNTLKYGIFTKELKSLSADTECTVAADHAPESITDSSNLGLSDNNWSHLYSNISAGKNKLTVRIHGDVIKKVKLAPYDSTQSAVAPAKASTLLMRSLLKRNATADVNGENVDSNESGKEVTVGQDGCAVFDNVQPGSYKITGYDKDNQVIDVKYKTITNASSGDPSTDGWKYDINTNYFGHISNALLDKLLDTKLRAPATLIANGYTYKKSADKQYTKQLGVAENKQIDFEASFNNLATLSTELADAKSADNVKVYYETPESLRENNRSFTDSDNGWTIINVDLTNAGTSYTLPGQYKDNSGTQMNGASYDNAHSRIIWNFYTSDGTTSSPYTGTITMGGTLCGIMLAPRASVSGASGDLGGCVAAASYGHTTGEVHQRSYNPSSHPIDQNLEETLSNKEVNVTKEWKNDDKYPDYRPDSISVTITGKTSPENPAKTITRDITVKGSSWEETVKDLPRTDADGNEYTYTVKENLDEKMLTNYTPSDPTLMESNDNGVPIYSFTIKNTFKTIDIFGTKTWNDNGNQDGKRPSSITVKLLKNNKDQIDSKTVSAADEWNYKFEKLPENDTNGNKIIYSVAEADVPEGYTSKVTGNAKTGFTITNTHTPETTSVSGTKTWDDNNNQDGKRPKSITVNLLKNGEKINSAIVDSSNGWQYSFANLPKYDNGKEITYTLTEDAVVDYSTKVNGYNITNSYTPGKTSVTVTKAWLDNNNADKKRPASIQVQLYANGEKSGEPVTLSESTNWTYTWSGLDAKKSGTDIKYTVKEVNTPNGYTSNVSGNAEKGYTITNTEEKTTPPTPVTPTYTTYTVHKVWDLGSGELVPDSVQMQLYKNGAAYGSPVTVTKASGWTYTWTGLPQTENGKLNTWSVKEVDPDNQYTATVVNGTSSATVTNRSNNNAGGKTQVSVHKVWKLDNGRTAASSVQAQLYRNGEAYGDPVTLSAGNSWSHVWTGLTKTDAQGNTISWTVREVNVPSGFTSTVTGTDRSFTITNDDKPQDNHNKNNKPVNPNNNNKNNKPVTPNNKKNTPVNPGTPSIPKNTGTVVNRGTSAGSTPRTGDQTSLGFWLAMLTAGAAGTAAAVLLKRRKSADEDRD